MALCIISPPAGQALTLPPPQSLPFSLQGLGFLPDPLLCLLLCCQWWAASTLRHAIVVPVHMIQTCCALVARMIILAESPRIWKRVLVFCSVGGRTAESSLPCTLAHPGQSVARNLLGCCQSLTISSLVRAHNVPPFWPAGCWFGNITHCWSVVFCSHHQGNTVTTSTCPYFCFVTAATATHSRARAVHTGRISQRRIQWQDHNDRG